MDNENFSFRWGVDLFDNEHTQIPNWILKYYHRVKWAKNSEAGEGITNTEMMFIIHLSSFKYESENGKASPSLTKTLRERMGYKSNQGIINVKDGLVEKGLLVVQKRLGQRSVYDFSSFSKSVIKLAIANELEMEISTKDSSTKLDESDCVPDGDSSTKLDGDSSTKLDETRQQNLTLRREEEKNLIKEKDSLKINFELPPYSHLELDKHWVYLKKDDNLVKAFVSGVTAKRMKLAIGGIDGVKMMNPNGNVFYQNGHDELQKVVIGNAENGISLTPDQLAMKDRLIDLTGAANGITQGKRIGDISKCQEAAIFMVKRGDSIVDIDRFERWFPTHWQGKNGEPITLKTLSNLWTTCKENKNGQGPNEGNSGSKQDTFNNAGSYDPPIGSGQSPEIRARLKAAFAKK